MKSITRFTLLIVALICATFIAAKSPLLAWASFFVVSAGLSPRVSNGLMQTPTLTTAEITADVFAAFRKRLPALRAFSTDFTAKTAVYGQQVIAHVAAVPTAADHNSASYFNSPTSASTLLTDVPITMNQWKDVVLKLTDSDATTSRSKKYVQAVNGAGYALAKSMIDSVLANVNSTNMSFSATCTAANATAAKLRLFTETMNTNGGSGNTRHALVNGAFMTGLLSDAVIGSGDYFAQRQEGQREQVLTGVMGFDSVMEYSGFPANTAVIAEVTAATTDLITAASAHGLIAGDRVRFTTTTTLPAGLSLATNYFVIASGLTTTAFKVSATSGGSAVDITDTGTGTHSVSRYENLNGVCFEENAIAVTSRIPNDSIALAQQRGIPIPLKVETQTDPETGLTLLVLERLNTATLDIEICYSVMWGSAVGRQGGTAATLMDQGALRIVQA